MLRTATALLVLVVFVCVGQLDAAITRTENFDVDPGWIVVGSGKNGNDFGYQTSSHAGGGSPGEAGGRFTRSEFVRYYADTDIGGTMTLDQPFSASGKFACTDAFHPDYGYPFGVGHFSTSGYGMVGINFTEVDTDDLHWRAGIVLDDFITGFGTTPLLVTENDRHTWAYDWNPTGGTTGTGLLTVNLDSDIYTIELNPTDRAKGATLDAFGFAGIAAPNRSYSDWYADMYIDDVTYSVIPEPSSILIWLLMGAIGPICYGRNRRKRSG